MKKKKKEETETIEQCRVKWSLLCSLLIHSAIYARWWCGLPVLNEWARTKDRNKRQKEEMKKKRRQKRCINECRCEMKKGESEGKKWQKYRYGHEKEKGQTMDGWTEELTKVRSTTGCVWDRRCTITECKDGLIHILHTSTQNIQLG